MTTDFEYNALRLQTAGREHEQHILNAISNCGIATLCYAYKSRVKTEEKLVEKVKRKIKEKPDYSLTSITDVIGLRLITLFRNEIPQVLREVLALIKHEKDLKPNPFEASHFEEVIIYTNAPSYDPFLTELQNVLSEHMVVGNTIQSAEGYSSVHIVCRLVHDAKIKINDFIEIPHKLPVEIQIRSVFEDAWGEIDHRFGYTIREGKDNDNLMYNSSLVQPHLKVLKQFADACAQYADTIYASAHTPVAVKDTAGKIASVPSDDEVLKRFAVLGVSEIFCKRYIEGRRLREDALNLIESDRTAGKELCLKAAAFFLTINQDTSNVLTKDTGLLLYSFYARMNEALCLLSTDSPQHVKSAESMYIKLREEYPGYLLVKFRLAQAYSKLGAISDAIDLFKQTENEAKLVALEHAENSSWPDQLPKADYEHIAPLLPKLLGYQYWKKSLEIEDRDEQLIFLNFAIEATKEGLSRGGEEHKIQNNLVYYSVEYLSRYEGRPNATTKRIATLLLSNLSKMEDYLKLAPKGENISTLDTMMHAYNFLGRTDRAQNFSMRILGLVKDSKDGDPEEVLDITRGALEIQALQAPPNDENKMLDTFMDV
ncbi:MAG: hypothetical protein V4632_23665 [Pseudomonadota bacterium]